MFSLIPAVIALSVGLSATAHPLRSNAAAARHHSVGVALRADEKLPDPEGWATGYLEDYTTYHNRYLAIDCDHKHDTEFWDKCCHPMLATENLDEHRDSECNPANASSSGSNKSDNHNNTDDEEDCDEEDDDSHDSGSQKAQSAPKTSSHAAAAAAVTPDAPKSSPKKEDPQPTSSKKADPEPSSTKKEETKTSSSQSSQETPKGDSGSKNDNGGGDSGNSFTGQFTWYKQEGKPGNCGDYHSDDDMIAAMNTAQYSGGSVCGKKISITADNGKSVTVTVVDSCPGCAKNSVDLSTAAFRQLNPESVGLFKGTWKYI